MGKVLKLGTIALVIAIAAAGCVSGSRRSGRRPDVSAVLVEARVLSERFPGAPREALELGRQLIVSVNRHEFVPRRYWEATERALNAAIVSEEARATDTVESEVPALLATLGAVLLLDNRESEGHRLMLESYELRPTYDSAAYRITVEEQDTNFDEVRRICEDAVPQVPQSRRMDLLNLCYEASHASTVESAMPWASADLQRQYGEYRTQRIRQRQEETYQRMRAELEVQHQQAETGRRYQMCGDECNGQASLCASRCHGEPYCVNECGSFEDACLSRCEHAY